jgi:VWFA-related protein
MAQEQSAPEFKSGVTMIQVPVAVRDRQGQAVAGLQKEDFSLFDNGKPVEIAAFSLEKPGGLAAPDRSLPEPGGVAKPTAPAMDVPEQFTAYVFDDISIGVTAVLQQAREAAAKQIQAMQPGDRIALVTTSCTSMEDFTNDRAKLIQALARIQLSPAPVCRVSRTQILQVEVLKNVVKRMANLPGRRSILLISAGFEIGHDRTNAPPVAIEAAARAKVVINCLDTGGGLRPGYSAAANPNAYRGSTPYSGLFISPLVLEDLATGTAGTYLEGNDYDRNFRALSTPDTYYVLAFVSTARPDGSLHQLKVKLEKKGKFNLQARGGYYAGEGSGQ